MNNKNLLWSAVTTTFLTASSLLISGCAGTASASISTTCNGDGCETSAGAQVSVIFKIDHEGNERKELYAYVSDDLIELDFSKFAVNYTGQNAFVTNKPGDVTIILKSFGNEIARKTFSYHIDTQSSAIFTNPSAVKSWVLIYDGVDEFSAKISDIEPNYGGTSGGITTAAKYSGNTLATSTYSYSRPGNGGGAEEVIR